MRWSSHSCSTWPEAQHLRDLPLRQHRHVERHARLKLRQLEKLLHEQRRIHIARFRLDDDADILGELVVHIAEQRQLLGLQQIGHLLDEPRLLHAIGNFGDDDLVCAAARVLDMPARAQAEGAAPGLVGFDKRRLIVHKNAARRKVRPVQETQERLHARARTLDEVQRRVAHLLQIMRRNARRHADRDAAGAVREQVRDARGEHDRLLLLAVIGLAEIDRVFVDAVEQRRRDGRQLGLGVAHRRRVIAVDIAEIALAVDQRIALREILREPHQRVVNGLVAMRVIFTDHVADDARAFLEAARGVELELAHGVEQAAVHRLQAVAHIGQRALRDGGERVGEVALFKRILQLDRLDGRRSENRIVGHGERGSGCGARRQGVNVRE